MDYTVHRRRGARAPPPRTPHPLHTSAFAPRCSRAASEAGLAAHELINPRREWGALDMRLASFRYHYEAAARGWAFRTLPSQAQFVTQHCALVRPERAPFSNSATGYQAG